MLYLNYLIPPVAGILFRVGGTDQWKWCPLNQKLWRWLMGIVIGLLLWKGYILYSITIASYFLATNLFGYGDKTPILKYLPKPLRFFVSGLMFGLASIPLIGWRIGLVQGFFGGFTFLALMYLDDADILKNPWQELFRGSLGTCFYFLAI